MAGYRGRGVGSYAARRGQKEEKLNRITKQLEDGIRDLFTSENYKNYLKTMGRFHHYSFNNTILIALQKPDATLVAGYTAWQKRFHRNVRKGEHGITIFAPVKIRDRERDEKERPDRQEQPEQQGGSDPEAADHGRQARLLYRTATVFDVSQTEGEPLPSLGPEELFGQVPDYQRFMDALVRISPVPVTFDEIPGGAKGYYQTQEKRICIQKDMSEMQTMKTCVHEITHAELHDRDTLKQENASITRNSVEVEAESVAYVICEYFGLDTSEYSFPYIAGWSSSQEMKELKASMERIRQTAGRMIDGISRELYPEQELAVKRDPEDCTSENNQGSGRRPVCEELRAAKTEVDKNHFRDGVERKKEEHCIG